MSKRIAAGVLVTPETLATDLIKQIGPRGDYMLTQHTLSRLRSDEFLVPRVSVRTSRASWEAAGRKDTYQMARDQVRQLSQTAGNPIDSKRAGKLAESFKAWTRLANCGPGMPGQGLPGSRRLLPNLPQRAPMSLGTTAGRASKTTLPSRSSSVTRLGCPSGSNPRRACRRSCRAARRYETAPEEFVRRAPALGTAGPNVPGGYCETNPSFEEIFVEGMAFPTCV
jgi:hypothetical protein